MAISLNTQTASAGALKNLGKTLKDIGASIGRLASGSRLNKAADDAANDESRGAQCS
jgi:flagellin-like hook-associated protein FlgL